MVFGAFRWLSGKSDETSKAVVTSITTPIERAARAEAEANVRGALTAVQIYFAENGTYAGVSTAALRANGDGPQRDGEEHGAVARCSSQPSCSRSEREPSHAAPCSTVTA